MRKERQKLRTKLGGMEIHEGWKKRKSSGPPPPFSSVIFLVNTAEGELARRF